MDKRAVMHHNGPHSSLKCSIFTFRAKRLCYITAGTKEIVNSTIIAQCTQLCTTRKKLGVGRITLFDTFSLLFQKEKNLMPLFF